jgi:hypothetical protein
MSDSPAATIMMPDGPRDRRRIRNSAASARLIRRDEQRQLTDALAVI